MTGDTEGASDLGTMRESAEGYDGCLLAFVSRLGPDREPGLEPPAG